MKDSSSKTLVIVPLAGLGNRMRAIVSAQIIAEKQGWNVQVDWQIDPENCHCNLHDLFEENPHCLQWNSYDYPEGAVCLLEKITAESCETIIELMKKHPMVWIQSLFSYHHPVGDHTNKISKQQASDKLAGWLPTQNLLQRKLQLDGTVMGIHIRRKDCIRSSIHGPLSLFIRLMRKKLKQNPNLKFFVCSDDAATVQLLRQRFNSKIIFTYNHPAFKRNSIAGMQEGFLDFLSLADCQTIVSSFYSSFADLASMYGKSSFIRLKRKSASADYAQAGQFFDPWVYWAKDKGWSRSKQGSFLKNLQSYLIFWYLNWTLSSFSQLGFWHRDEQANS